MTRRKGIILLAVCCIVFFAACVPQNVQLKGTWEFVGYKEGRVRSIIDIDSTVCFDGDGNGLYYSNNDPSVRNYFSYVISDDHKLVIIIGEKVSTVEYSIDSKTKRLTIDGLEYRLVSSEADAIEAKAVEQAPSVPPTPIPIPTPEILAHPSSLTEAVGSTAIFRVEASDAVSYQWQYQKPDETVWQDVTEGGNAATLTQANVEEGDNGCLFRCRVANEGGSVFSDAARLTAVLESDVSGKCGDNLSWRFDASTGELTIEGSGAMYDYNENDKSPWSEASTKIESISLPCGLTRIGDRAFDFCSSLTSITIPNGVISIGNIAFSACFELTSITIPNGVISIGYGAFIACVELTSITIPDGITNIGSMTFWGCKKLTSVTVPNSVTRIEDNAFDMCTELMSITIPNSVTFIGWDAFDECTKLTDVYYRGSAKQREQLSIEGGNSYLLNATWHYQP